MREQQITIEIGTGEIISKPDLEKVSVKVSCTLADVMSAVTSREIADSALMKFARLYKFHNRGRAAQYLTKYLNGDDKAEYFPLSQLIQDDAGVRTKIRSHFQGGRMCYTQNITIKQQDYRSLDWWGSLGTYFLYFVEVPQITTLIKNSNVVLAWGEDTYDWHPEDKKRFTQCIHQAAHRLQNSHEVKVPTAKPFKMYATDCLIDVATGMPVPGPLNSFAYTSAKVSLRDSIPPPPKTYICR